MQLIGRLLKKYFFIHRLIVLLYRLTWYNLPAGQQHLGVEIAYAADENKSNNLLFRDLVVLMQQNVLHLNEIKFLTFDGEAEWIEIINTGLNPVSVEWVVPG